MLERSISDCPPPKKTTGQMKSGRHVLCCKMQRLNTSAATDNDKNKTVPAGREIA